MDSDSRLVVPSLTSDKGREAQEGRTVVAAAAVDDSHKVDELHADLEAYTSCPWTGVVHTHESTQY
jgi:hypothetical protein